MAHGSRRTGRIATMAFALFVTAACTSPLGPDDAADAGVAGMPNPTSTATTSLAPAASPPPATTPTPTLRPTQTPTPTPTATPAPRPTSTPTPEPLPASAHLDPMRHEFQTWNNCSAVSASMALSYFGIERTQAQLARVFRPNPDDKHVEPRQLIAFFPQYGLGARLVEGGSIETVKRLVAAGFPVIAPQWLDHKPDAIGHYRIVRGYDDARGGFLVNDSMIGADVFLPYAEFEELWVAFNYRFIPVYRPEDEAKVLAILGADADRKANLERTLKLFQDKAAQAPDDAYVWFSIGSSLFELGRYDEAVAAYERAEAIGLPPKMLWYQFWPVAAYNNVDNHQRALDLAAAQIAGAGVFGEMQYERGRAFEALGQTDQAVAAYRRALNDDANLAAAQAALDRLGA